MTCEEIETILQAALDVQQRRFLAWKDRHAQLQAILVESQAEGCRCEGALEALRTVQDQLHTTTPLSSVSAVPRMMGQQRVAVDAFFVPQAGGTVPSGQVSEEDERTA